VGLGFTTAGISREKGGEGRKREGGHTEGPLRCREKEKGRGVVSARGGASHRRERGSRGKKMRGRGGKEWDGSACTAVYGREEKNGSKCHGSRGGVKGEDTNKKKKRKKSKIESSSKQKNEEKGKGGGPLLQALERQSAATGRGQSKNYRQATRQEKNSKK